MLVTSNINKLSEEELDRIEREEFQENDDEINEAIDNIEKWIDTCPHLANTRKDRDFLRYKALFYGGQ